MSALFSDRKVLLIEDSTEGIYNTKNTIIRSGLAKHVVVKLNSQLAVEYLSMQENFPELVIYNNEIPDVNGELLLSDLQSLPIILAGRSKFIILSSKNIHHYFNMMVSNGQLFGLLEGPLTTSVCKFIASAIKEN
ncbi:hypothetical protein [Reichenbachiella versicolor]|uniref:hypothetical protein n=1 Tax=Reichenbachiella versicolor TaxID=1821036 RepID=UPI000D6E75F2|nr:hypothetical protein [Reichenbachiella versicolor]